MDTTLAQATEEVSMAQPYSIGNPRTLSPGEWVTEIGNYRLILHRNYRLIDSKFQENPEVTLVIFGTLHKKYPVCKLQGNTIVFIIAGKSYSVIPDRFGLAILNLPYDYVVQQGCTVQLP